MFLISVIMRLNLFWHHSFETIGKNFVNPVCKQTEQYIKNCVYTSVHSNKNFCSRYALKNLQRIFRS